MVNATPAAEVQIDEALVRGLLADQAPALAELPLRPLASGWDNTILALGDDLLVRLPHRKASVDLVRYEHRWLPELAPRLPVAIPVPVVFGRPSVDFPWPWSVVDRIQGADAIIEPPDADGAVDVLAGFFSAMHTAAPQDAPPNPWRGGPLVDRDEVTQRRFDLLDGWLDGRADSATLQALWRAAVDADAHAGPPVWIHGDMHPGNVIVRDAHIVSVIDFGDLTAGDPATDLGCAWMFFDQSDRLRFRALVGADGAMWDRARGWALSVSLAIAENSADNPRYEAMAARTLTRVAGDTA